MPIIILIAVFAVLAMLYRGFTMVSAYGQGTHTTAAKAKLLRKETHVSTHIDANGAMMSDDVYQLVFSLETGGEITFRVNHKAYDNTPENEWGTLAYQGTRFVGFEFKSEEHDK
jgi:hypothetical protein